MPSARSYKTRGIVLRGRALGEADRIFTLFSTQSGKLDAVAKGIKRAKSHLAGRLEFATECEFEMHRGRSLDIIVHASIVKAHWQALVEPDRYAVAQLVAELIDAFCEPELALPDVYALLTGMLAAIAASDAPRALLPRFSLRLLAALGLEPPFGACIRCGRPLAQTRAWVDADVGGLICEACRERWRDLPELDRDDLANFEALCAPRGGGRAKLAARPRVTAAVEAIIEHHLGRRPKAAV
ncbi:MAG TPA: DNA repair protein RecO [Candidatus Baltobacteraceae bacterium]|nr:DNA repair protein RecO [Candidatus Baltobacteraceae bacterium]